MSMRILLIEDNSDSIMITKRILKERLTDFEVEYETEAPEGLNRILNEEFDLVLCDYNMPKLTALDIIKEVTQKGIDVPFVIVTSAGSEKIAVELMKEGAYDYIIKDSTYDDTLPFVIKRSLEGYNAKKEKGKLEEKIKQAAQEWETTFNSITDLILLYDKDGKIIRVNNAFGNAYKIQPEEIIGKSFEEVFRNRKKTPSGHYVNVNKEIFETKKASRSEFFEPYLEIHVELSELPILNDKREVTGIVHIIKDITERKKIEEQIQRNLRDLESFKKIAVGRENKMIELKKEINKLSRELGRDEPHDVSFAD